MKSIASHRIPKQLPLIVVMLIPAVGVCTAAAQCTHGDLDGSGSVGLPDYAAFLDCTTGPNLGPAPPNCGPVDFDADTDVDLLDFATFQHLFGVTHGTLFAIPVFHTGDGPGSLATGDLDGDGDLDLAVANFDGNNISVLLNRGDGTAADSVIYGACSSPISVAIADLDGDGDLDIAVVNAGHNNISVLLNEPWRRHLRRRRTLLDRA